ncbi:hypothetical protein [Paraburkholderia sp. GAS199]|uniref:hypothetical protein n=1 Tax=Paraburkholderia sp. GAS199 TaxID=3035126 RepID=UPI003D21249C
MGEPGFAPVADHTALQSAAFAPKAIVSSMTTASNRPIMPAAVFSNLFPVIVILIGCTQVKAQAPYKDPDTGKIRQLLKALLLAFQLMCINPASS